MAFKLSNPPYAENQTPVYERDLGPGVLGESLKNQVIILNDKQYQNIVLELCRVILSN